MEEKISVHWNDFNTNLSSGFHEILCREHLTDVTFLADGQFIKAHRLLLSICSPYFQEMFVQMPANQHAFVFLKDVNHSILKDLLLFMYCGEVKISEDNLREFANLAESLKVKGLASIQSSVQKRIYSEPSTSSKSTNFDRTCDPLSAVLEPTSVEMIRAKIEPPDFDDENPTEIEFNENNSHDFLKDETDDQTESYNPNYYGGDEQEDYSEHEMLMGTFDEPERETSVQDIPSSQWKASRTLQKKSKLKNPVGRPRKLVDQDDVSEKEEEGSKSKRVVWSKEIKKLAIEHHLNLNGTLADTIKDLRRLHPGSLFEVLTISVLHSWLPRRKNKRTQENKDTTVSKKGRKSYLPDHLLEEFKHVVDQLIGSQAKVSTKTVLSKLRAVATKKGYGNLLLANGGKFKMGSDWLRWFFRNKMKLSLRKSTKAAQNLAIDYESKIYQMVQRLAVLVSLYGIPKDFVVYSDQTDDDFVPTGRTWTMNGGTEVPILGEVDNRQVTAVVSSTPSGQMLPTQLIFKGKENSTRALPLESTVKNLLDDGWNLTQTPNHDGSVTPMKQFVDEILAPHFNKKIEELNKQQRVEDQKVVWITECGAVHKSKEFREYMSKKYPWILILYVPASCTVNGQPLDMSLQKPLKEKFMIAFDEWAYNEIKLQLDTGMTPENCQLNLKTRNIKALVANWIYSSHKLCSENINDILMGWEKPGLSKAWEAGVQVEALKEHNRGSLFGKNITDAFPGSQEEESEIEGEEYENSQFMESFAREESFEFPFEKQYLDEQLATGESLDDDDFLSFETDGVIIL